MIKVKYRFDLKYHINLQKLLKKMTEDWIAVKPDIFLTDKAKLGLTTLFNDNDSKDLSCKCGIAIMCYSVLCKTEILLI